MKAVAIEAFGGSDRLRVMDLPKPEPGSGEVLIRVEAAGVNPVDWKIREGWLVDLLPHAFPLILGWDAAGVVEAAGSGATRFRVGDEVYTYCRKPVVQHGAYAEYVTMPEYYVAPRPERLTFAEAAAAPLAALTAWQALFDAAGLRRGEAVLVQGAAGGVGHFAVQLARHAGARVLGTAGPANQDFVRALGAERVVDYTARDVGEAVREAHPGGVDVVFDGVGGEVLARSAALVRPGGRLVSIVDPGRVEDLKAGGLDARFVFVSPHAAQLRRLGALFDGGQLRVELSGVLPLDQAAEAHRQIETHHTRGKIVLTP